ncbi:hypothetical protein WA538_002040 [Blastocystis sp. DL]
MLCSLKTLCAGVGWSPHLLRSVSIRMAPSLVLQYSYLHSSAVPFAPSRFFASSTNHEAKQKITWRDIYNMVDEPENRKKPLLQRFKGIKNQVIRLGGIRVVVFHTATMFVMWGVMYAFLKYDILDMDTLIAFMNRYSFTSQYSQMVLNHPEASYLILSYLAINLVDPIRYMMTLGYMGYIVRKRYLQIALDNIDTENHIQKKVVDSIKVPSLEAEEKKNPKLKSSRIITMKGKNNSRISM